MDALAATYLFTLETDDGQKLTLGPADARALEAKAKALFDDLTKSLATAERFEADRRAKAAVPHLDGPSLGAGPLAVPEST